MRYGVLVDIAQKVYNEEVIDLAMGHVNVIWQGDANNLILRSLSLCESPAIALNISGEDTVTVAAIAKRLGEFMDKTPKFSGTEADSALLSNVSKSKELLGSPEMALDTV